MDEILDIPADIYDGLARQLEILESSQQMRGGWKVGLTSGRMRDSMGAGIRPFGYILSSRIFQSGVSLNLSEVGDIGVENELVFVFAETVPRNASEQEIADCIKGVAAGFELNERRLPDGSTRSQRLADNLSQWGIVVNRQMVPLASVDLEQLQVSLACDDSIVETIVAMGHIDSHLHSLKALSQMLALFDRNIEKDDHVITGAFTRQRVTRPSNWEGDFGSPLGSVKVSWR